MSTKISYIILFFVLTHSVSSGQGETDNPPRSEAGKCFAKCLINTPMETREEVFYLYNGADKQNSNVQPMEVLIDSKMNHRVLLKVVTDTILEKDFIEHRIETRTSQKLTEWQEVVCASDLNAKLIKRIEKALEEEGFLNREEISEGVLSPTTIAAILAYQEKMLLPIGSVNIKTLEALGIKH